MDVTPDGVSLVVPVKPLKVAKSRLRGTARPGAHAALALALAHDTVTAARAASAVSRIVVVSSDPVVAAELGGAGVEVVPDRPVPGLNEAYLHGAALLDPTRPVAALQADLPALRPAELDEALAAALALFAGGHPRRAFCADGQGTGTTLLVAASFADFQPQFGVGSADRHLEAGAAPLTGEWPSLRRDVDTSEDLQAAAALGLGAHTSAVLAPSQGCAR